MIEWQPVVAQGIKVLGPKIIDIALKSASAPFQRKLPYSNLSFANHFEYSYERCTKIKTIVNGDRPIDLLTNYVSPDFSSDSARKIDEYAFLDLVWSSQRTALIASAGAGKSMFMGYLWIACTVEPRGKIPIFIELRKFNEIKQIDFGLYCFITCTQGSTGDVRLKFDDAINEGQFIFVLDGFDEVKSDRKAHVEEWILTIGKTKNTVIVSGRPDPAFNSWQTFSIFKMLPMTLKQTIDLISRVDFDSTVKTKFMQELKSKLYEKHKTFASRPLLATMMLLTYGSYADMPEKIHVFYDQAFDTLFSRHDATKEAFKRERSTKYPIDVFKRYLSVFSLITYNENKTSFTESEVLEIISKVAAIENISIEADLYLKDLLDCVCILQRDGLQIVYSHRSFQEYFTAYGLARLSEDRVSALVQKFAWRSTDTVLSMLFDINKDLFIRSYLYPRLAEYFEKTKHITVSSNVAEYIDALDCGFDLRYMDYIGRANTILFSLAPSGHSMVAVRVVAIYLYKDYLGSKSRSIRIDPTVYHPRQDYSLFRKKILPLIRKRKIGTHFSIHYSNRRFTCYFHGQITIGEIILSDDETQACKEWLQLAEFKDAIWKEHIAIIKIYQNIEREFNNRSRTLTEILNIG